MKHLNTLLNGVIPKRKEKHDLTINEQKIAQRLAPFLRNRLGKKNGGYKHRNSKNYSSNLQVATTT